MSLAGPWGSIYLAQQEQQESWNVDSESEEYLINWNFVKIFAVH